MPVINAQLHELGLFERLARSSFVKKIGNVVVWGPDRRPWSPDFLLFEAKAQHEGTIDLTGFDYRPLAGSTLPLDETVTSFNVRRDEFDKLLLELPVPKHPSPDGASAVQELSLAPLQL